MQKKSFSPPGYVSLIRSIIEMGYQFVDLRDFDNNTSKKKVILRHDVDYSPKKAVELAKLDHSLGVTSTFFFLVRGHWYNFFGHYTQNALQKIHALGFPIGLHYAPPPHIGDDKESNRQQLLRDFSMMRSELPSVCPAYSWHVPPPLILRGNKIDTPDNIVDMYSETYFREAKYVSDSSLRNSYEYLEKIFTSGQYHKVQLLLHAECWIGSREMSTLADMVAEILRSAVVEGEADLMEKPDYRTLLPLGIPDKVLDQVTDIFKNAIETSQNKLPER